MQSRNYRQPGAQSGRATKGFGYVSITFAQHSGSRRKRDMLYGYISALKKKEVNPHGSIASLISKAGGARQNVIAQDTHGLLALLEYGAVC